MKFALNIAEDGRVLSVTYPEYAPKDALQVDKIPEGNVADYIYKDGEFVHDPLPKPSLHEELPTQLDRIEAQVTYTAMMTDTLLGV